MSLQYKDWNIEAITGYKPQTTYYMDFSIADKFGEKAIVDTFLRAIEGCKSLGYVYLTELVMVLNWKIWEHYDNGNTKYAKLYNDLWMNADEYAVENLEGAELTYYFRTTD